MSLNSLNIRQFLDTVIAEDAVNKLQEAEADGWTADRIFETLHDYQLHPLVLAASEGAENCLRYLISKPTKYPDLLPYTLVEAVRENHLGTAQILVAQRVNLSAEPHSEDSDEDVAISAAMEVCNPDMVRLLCEAGAVFSSEAAWLNESIRAGLRCRKKGKQESLALLANEILKRLVSDAALSLDVLQLKRLADYLRKSASKPNASQKLEGLPQRLAEWVDGESALKEEALDCAVDRDRTAELARLLSSLKETKRRQLGAEVLPYLARGLSIPEKRQLFLEILSWQPEMNHFSDGGKTAIHFIAQDGELDLLRRVVELGADANLLDQRTGESALDWASLGEDGPHREATIGYLRSIGAKTGNEVRAEQAEK